ncbi:MAG TPA: T9SS type A sorting domain-containing protein, partial [Calditrichia bacterium]|nr:T9SS type A sorting domain-containing protein [Calditrichia bacterium]
VDLPFAPLAAQLSLSGTGQDLVESYLVSDGDGLITAYSADGQLLPDFPLSAGETLAASPLVLDIDGDGDSELAALTQSGRLYVWDLASPYRGDFWNQPYGNALNSNRQLPGQTILGSGNPAADLLPKESVYNWPNPNQDNFTFIRYRLNSAAEVSIKIFDLAGDLVANLTGTGIANTDNEVRWDLSAVESGVYLARVEARGGGGSAAQMIKIAVVK